MRLQVGFEPFKNKLVLALGMLGASEARNANEVKAVEE